MRSKWISHTSTLLSLREKVIAYPVDWRPVRKAYSKLYTFLKRPVEIWGVLYLSKNVNLRILCFSINRVMIKENVCGRNGV